MTYPVGVRNWPTQTRGETVEDYLRRLYRALCENSRETIADWRKSWEPIYTDGTLVGVGTTSPTFKISIADTGSVAGRTIGINGTPVLYLPDQTSFLGSMAIGNGLRSLSHTTAVTGQYNTAVGVDALLNNTTGWFNTAIGYGAMTTNTTGVYSVAVGQGALHLNTTGVNNTAVGVSALYNNTTANYNVAVGLDAMQYNVDGEENVAVGKRALFNGSGKFNTAVGNEARIGGAVEGASVSGNYNTVVGHQAMTADVTGSYNTAIGAAALQAITASEENTAVGRSALLNITSGDYNVALGADAGRFQADGTTPLTSTNTSVYIGYNAMGYSNSDANSIVIGCAAVGMGANTVVLGNDSIVSTALKGDVTLNGMLEFTGTATVWNDINIGSTTLGTGASAPDLVAINSTSVGERAFDGNATTEQLFGTIEIPHSAKNASAATFHVHWMPTTTNAGNVKWQVDYHLLSENSAATTVTTITGTTAAGGVAWKHLRTDLSGTITVSLGQQLCFRIYRNPSDAADTYPDDAILLTAGLHIEEDTVGSRTITTK